jgi:hypothetical protein
MSFVPGMMIGSEIMPWAGALIGLAAGVVCLLSMRRHKVQLEQTSEELHILLRQHQTEYLDEIGQVGRAVTFLEQSAQNTEEVIRGRLTTSLRSQAMQLLRAGTAAENAAVRLGIARRDMRLIARVSRILSSH